MGLFNENGECSKWPSSKAAGLLARGAYNGVREHAKSPRTQLAAFFNIPRKGSEDLATSSTFAVDSSNLGQAPRVLLQSILREMMAEGHERIGRKLPLWDEMKKVEGQ